MKIIKFIICLLFGLMFINAGLNKFFLYMPMPELTAEQMDLYQALGKLKWITPLTGIVEILGGLLFIFPRTRALGAIVILPVMVGIVAHNVTFEPSGLLIVIPLLLINLWIIFDNWSKYQRMIRAD
ncbi:MauE/DoxX family redox-associated membrane protein [Sphingobacterium suaedae]|uniref:MauE/DoxX family redox-associated membrane protein n=1 Tax=Sphingobacterium suaedae TaxID=1686402 RepID=A0ABW5KEY5_9SPHI